MAESALEKVLRLAAGAQPPGRKPVNVRQYRRVVRNRVEAVRQHVQGHVAGTGLHPVTAGTLKAGNVVRIGNAQYLVTSAKPYVRRSSAGKPNAKGTSSGVNTGSGIKTGSQGKGVRTGAPASTASAGAGLAAAANPQAILDAAAKAAKVPPNAPEVFLGLRQTVSGKSIGVIVARTLPIQVVR